MCKMELSDQLMVTIGFNGVKLVSEGELQPFPYCSHLARRGLVLS